MKIISIYILLAFLTIVLLVTVDILSGVSMTASIRSLFTVFSTTTLQETVCMIFFVSLPFLQVIVNAFRRSRTR